MPSVAGPPRRPVLLAISIAVCFVACVVIGTVAGIFWTFMACFKATCTATEENGYVIGLLGGLLVGGAAAAGAVTHRAFLYRHTWLLWTPVALIGATILWVGMNLVRG
ncbi:MAG: hypothetical protein ACRBI6_21090 [Acidimicrobiales bacterium]